MTSAPGRAEAHIKNIWVGFFSLPLPPLSSPSSLPSSPFSLMSSANVPRSDPETESAGTLWIELQNFEEPHLRTLGVGSDIIFLSRRKPAAHMAILSTLIFISMQFQWQFIGFEFCLNEMLILFNLPVFIIVRNKWAEDPFPLRKTHEGELSIPLTKAWQAHSSYDNTLWRELADRWDRKVSTDSALSGEGGPGNQQGEEGLPVEPPVAQRRVWKTVLSQISSTGSVLNVCDFWTDYFYFSVIVRLWLRLWNQAISRVLSGPDLSSDTDSLFGNINPWHGK